MLVCLVAARGAGRWALPKAWVDDDVPPPITAAAAAYEIAGLYGCVAEALLGSCAGDERVASDRTAAGEIDVYLLAVEGQLKDWPERDERERIWLAPAAAARLVVEPALADLLRGVDRLQALAPGS